MTQTGRASILGAGLESNLQDSRGLDSTSPLLPDVVTAAHPIAVLRIDLSEEQRNDLPGLT